MSLTKIDFKNIEELFKTILNQILNLEPGQTLDDKLDEKIGHLPTKEEFYTKEDEVLKELKTVREEMATLNGLHEKVNRHETQIEEVQNKLGIQTV